MPRIDDGILECVVYIYPDVPSAEEGQAAGGTGFLFGAVLSEDPFKTLTFVVTNRHIIDNGGRVARINTKDGRVALVEIEDHEWLRHPAGDDLAIARLLLSDAYKVNCLHYNLAINKSDVSTYNIGPAMMYLLLAVLSIMKAGSKTVLLFASERLHKCRVRL